VLTCIRILIVEANVVIRDGMRVVLERTVLPRSSVEAAAALPDESLLKETTILYLSDSRYAPTPFAALIRRLRETLPLLKVVVLSERFNAAFIKQTIQSGAHGFINMKDDMELCLSYSVSTLGRDLRYFSPKVAELLATDMSLVAGGDLTDTDKQVLRMIAQDYTVQQIAQQLGVSDRSVYRSKAKIREVLNIQNSDNIVDAARRQGLLEDVT
jgi:two-component system, NarL family, response regulator NreC